MIAILINLLIICLILGVVWWGITLIPLPHPLPILAQVVLIFLLVLVDMLTGVAGMGWSPVWRR